MRRQGVVEVALSGNLGFVPLDEVLRLLTRSDQRGSVDVRGEDIRGRIFICKKGISIAQKKSSRATNEGAVAIRIAKDKKSAAAVQLACETDFVARNDQFVALLERLTAQVLAQGSADVPQQKLADGKGTVSDLIAETISKLGENVQFVDARRVTLGGAGTIGGYVHSNQKIGVLVALKSDKAVAGEALDVLAKDLAMHIAATQVAAISGEEIDPAVLAKEKEIFTAQAKESGKPADIVEKMVQGRVNKFIKEVALLDQPFVKDPERSVKKLIAETAQQVSAKLSVDQFMKLQF